MTGQRFGLSGLESTDGRDERPAAGYELLARVGDALRAVSPMLFSESVDELSGAQRSGHRVYIMGNGGSAATATHFASDLTKGTRGVDGEPFRAFSLTDNTALLTAWANDTAFDRVFAEQLLAVLVPGDVVVAITCSGRSPNVLNGLAAAAEMRAGTIGLLGCDGGAAREAVEIPLLVPSWDFGVVESAHLAIVHAITSAIALGPAKPGEASPPKSGVDRDPTR